MVYQIVRYEYGDNRCPFTEWFSGLRDKPTKARILSRLRQVETGNLGDSASVGEGVVELRLHFGPGFRIYCGQSGLDLIILLCGGDKSSQIKDIQNAKAFWSDWKGKQP
jgi:putative addiction module killer protein